MPGTDTRGTERGGQMDRAGDEGWRTGKSDSVFGKSSFECLSESKWGRPERSSCVLVYGTCDLVLNRNVPPLRTQPMFLSVIRERFHSFSDG